MPAKKPKKKPKSFQEVVLAYLEDIDARGQRMEREIKEQLKVIEQRYLDKVFREEDDEEDCEEPVFVIAREKDQSKDPARVFFRRSPLKLGGNPFRKYWTGDPSDARQFTTIGNIESFFEKYVKGLPGCNPKKDGYGMAHPYELDYEDLDGYDVEEEGEEDLTDHYVIVQTRSGPKRKDEPYQMYYYGTVDKHPDEDNEEPYQEIWGPDPKKAVQYLEFGSASTRAKNLDGCEAEFRGTKYAFKYGNPEVIGVVKDD